MIKNQQMNPFEIVINNEKQHGTL